MCTKLNFYSELVYGGKTNFIHHDEKMQRKIHNKLRFMSEQYQNIINRHGFIMIPKSLQHLDEFALRCQEIADDIEILDFFNYYFAYGYEQLEQYLTLGFVDEELQEPLEAALSKCIDKLEDFTNEELQGLVIEEPTPIDEDDLNPLGIPLTDDKQIGQKVENYIALQLEQLKHLTRTPVQFVDVEKLPESTKKPVIEKKQHRKPAKRLKDCNFTKINDNTLYYHIEDGYYYNDFVGKDKDTMDVLLEDKISLLEQGVILVYSGGVGSGKTTDATRIVKEWALKDNHLPFIRTNRTSAKEQIDNVVWWYFDDNGNRVIVDKPNDDNDEVYFSFEIPLECYQAGFKEINTSKDTKILYHWDEPHYMVADSQFNKKTDEAYQELHNIIESGQSLLITSANCKDFMLKIAKKYPNRKFLIIDKKDNFNYVNNFFYFYRNKSIIKIIEKAKGKVMVGSNDMGTWRLLEKLEETGLKVAYVQSKNRPEIPDDFDSLSKREQDKIIQSIKNWDEREVLVERTKDLIIVKQNENNDNTHYDFEADVLCVTSAWDTGVSIINANITDIVNEFYSNPYSSYQLFGRVRIQDGQTVNFHIKVLKRDNFLKMLEKNHIYRKYKEETVEDVTLTHEIYSKDELRIFLEIERQFENEKHNILINHPLQIKEYQRMEQVVEQIKTLTYQKNGLTHLETLTDEEKQQVIHLTEQIEKLKSNHEKLAKHCETVIDEINHAFRRIYLEQYIRRIILRDYDCFFKSYESWYKEQFGEEQQKAKEERLNQIQQQRIELLESKVDQRLNSAEFKKLAGQLNFKDIKHNRVKTTVNTLKPHLQELGFDIEEPTKRHKCIIKL